MTRACPCSNPGFVVLGRRPDRVPDEHLLLPGHDLRRLRASPASPASSTWPTRSSCISMPSSRTSAGPASRRAGALPDCPSRSLWTGALDRLDRHCSDGDRWSDRDAPRHIRVARRIPGAVGHRRVRAVVGASGRSPAGWQPHDRPDHDLDPVRRHIAIGYLGPAITSTLSQVYHLIGGEVSARDLFVSPTAMSRRCGNG